MAEITAWPTKTRLMIPKSSIWDRYFDGQVWKLTDDDLGGRTKRSVVSSLRYRARILGIKIRIAGEANDGRTIYIQKVQP